jgi:hypothetical protein
MSRIEWKPKHGTDDRRTRAIEMAMNAKPFAQVGAVDDLGCHFVGPRESDNGPDFVPAGFRIVAVSDAGQAERQAAEELTDLRHAVKDRDAAIDRLLKARDEALATAEEAKGQLMTFEARLRALEGGQGSATANAPAAPPRGPQIKIDPQG